MRESCRKQASIDRGVDIYDELTECSTFNASPNDLSVEAIVGDATAIMCELSLGMYEHSKYHLVCHLLSIKAISCVRIYLLMTL